MPEIAVPKVQKLRFLNSYFFGNLGELAFILNYFTQSTKIKENRLIKTILARFLPNHPFDDAYLRHIWLLSAH